MNEHYNFKPLETACVYFFHISLVYIWLKSLEFSL